jgi:hypothetical protein
VTSCVLSISFIALNCFQLATHCVATRKVTKAAYAGFALMFGVCLLVNFYFFGELEEIAHRLAGRKHFLSSSMIVHFGIVVAASMCSYMMCDRCGIICAQTQRFDVVLTPAPVNVWHATRACVLQAIVPAHKASATMCVSVACVWFIATLASGTLHSVVLRHIGRVCGLLWSVELLLWALFMSMHTVRGLMRIVLVHAIDFSVLQTIVNKRTDPVKTQQQVAATTGSDLVLLLQAMSYLNAVSVSYRTNEQTSSDETPIWKHALNTQQQHVDKLLCEIKPSTSLYPYIPILSTFKNTNTASHGDHLMRLLAFQDFSRLARAGVGAAHRRRALFVCGLWSQFAHTCCGLIDSATLQVRF